MRAFAISASVLMVLVVFSQNPGSNSAQTAGGVDTFDEQARRLTVADGPSESPRVAMDASGTLRLAWSDWRGGSPAVYYKSTRNGGFTFSGDRPLTGGFRSISDVDVAADAGTRTVAVAWAGAVGADGDRVYVRASGDGGQTWGRPAAVGPGGSPSLTATSGGLVLAYVHGNGSSPTQVRLVALTLADGGGIRTGRGLVAFNASATDVALLVLGGTAHVVWVDHVATWVVLAHVSVNLATGAASPPHVIATFRANLGGSISLVGTGQRLALVWSDDSSGTFDVRGQMSLDGGSTWPVTLGISPGPSRSVAPSSSLGGSGVLAIAWQDNRTGRDQVFARLMRVDGNPATPVFRVSASPTAARDPAVAFGTGRNLNVAWSDARDPSSEIYADLDVLMDRPRGVTLAVYVKRLADTDFAPPPAESRVQLLGLIANASLRIDRRSEAVAAAFLREQVMTKFDGSSGGDARDDLVVNATAQADLTRLVNGILQDLEGRTRGTRDGEPDPSPPGEGQEPSPQPKGASGGTRPPAPTVYHVVVENVLSTNALVSWRITAPDTPIYESWVDWGIASTSEHRRWDNSSPYSVSIAPLSVGKTYKVRAGADYDFGIEWSNTYTFFVGVQVLSLLTTNVSSDRATVEWTTNVPATSAVSYGKNESNLGTTLTGANGTFHQVNLTGLGLRETYFYRVKSVALADPNLWNESGTQSFATEMRIENLTHAESLVAGYFNATFTWDTNFNATSQVRYGENTTLASRANGTVGYHHVVVVPGLKAKTAYYWQAYSAYWNGSIYAAVSEWSFDRSGTGVRTGDYVPPPEPKSESVLGSAPIVTWGTSIVNVTFTRQPNSITAKWNTTYRADAVLKVKTGTGSWTTYPVPESTLTHSVTAPNLISGTTYMFLLNSTATSNLADTVSSGNRNATTKGITISLTTSSPYLYYSAYVNWSTDGLASSVVRYGIRSIWESTATTAGDAMGHVVLLAGLLGDTTYKYRVESAAYPNRNDFVADIERTFHTPIGPNDANTSTDAGATFATALHVEPGVWTGWVNPASMYSDSYDYFRFQVFASQQIRARMTYGVGYDLNLYLYRPSGGAPAVQATAAACTSGPGECLTFDAGSEAGFWRLEVRLISGSGKMDYTLSFNATGGGLERFVVDVGALGGIDTDYTIQTPGINIGVINWTGRFVSMAPSTAVEAYRNPTVHPDYREVSPANGSFYLNLHRASWERYNDYLFTVQYFSSADSNVSVWNGAGWVVVAVAPGQANWRAFSFLLEHTLFYDAEPTRAGLNVKLRFEKVVQIDFLAAVPMKHTTYVGSGSDDLRDEYHVPGVRLLDGWISAGQGYKNATATGATVVVTVPDTTAGYLVAMRFDGNSSGITVQRWTGSAWAFISSVSNFSTGQALFVLDPTWYVDAYPTWPGMNVKIRLVPLNRLNETTTFVLSPVHWTTDVGATGDDVTTNHVPGMSVYTNGEWGPPVPDPQTGHMVRVAATSGENLYVNLPWPEGSMIGYLTYKAYASGVVRLYDGVGWTAVGTIVGDNLWHTSILFAQGGAIQGQGPGQGQALRMFHDDYGDAFVNALLEISVVITLDAMWLDVDHDGDNLTSFGEPHPYAVEDATPHSLLPGQYFDANWEALVEGRWQVDVTAKLQGTKDTQVYYAGILVSVDGTAIWTPVAGYRPTPFPPFVGSFPAMLCTGLHKLRITGAEDLGGVVLKVAFRKLPTDPYNPDTDGDGLRDGREACGKRTDPTSADTDRDGLTDYEETYNFNYNNATVVTANATTNVTVDAAGEYRWTVKTSATPVMGAVKAVIYLDGQLKWAKESSVAWTDLPATFDAILPKGLHSLQVQKATAKGSVTLKLVNITKPTELRTNALYWDSDKDFLSDGDEVLGRTGWMTSPTKADTDSDGAPDGTEMRTLHSDPLLRDTDHDGFRDGIDLDPLYDLVVQLRVGQFTAFDSCNDPNPCLSVYRARVTVAGNWTDSQSLPRYQNNVVNHILSVNVRDDASIPIKIQVLRNDGTELDIVPTVGVKAYSDNVNLRAADRFNQFTGGEESLKADLWYDVRVVRVGKANTLLLAPNDWSTLSNGTVDAKPTGLHRYLGEQRFVVGLLNVTDGQGNVASYDLETKESDGKYTDASANALHACRDGPVASGGGYFGSGVSLSGSGTDLYTCTAGYAAKLNAIYQSMTVAFWIRPDQDYVASGTGWAWSFGRKDIWRVGFDRTVPGLRFAVNDPTAGWRSAAATFPVYAARWVHVAAVLANGQEGPLHWSNLSVYVNGERIAYQTFTSWTSVRTGITFLYLGWDEASGPSAGRFRGTIDEFRLYSTVLFQNSVRGLVWFLQGANNVLIPRGIFYESQLYGKLNDTSLDSGAPFAGATAYGNSNTLGSNLNSRVIQLVIAKNLTLAQAWGILDLARTNSTNALTSFPFFATSEFYTLGFVSDVRNITANTVVVNGGNYSYPPPPPSLWQLFWNTVAGWAERIWNAVTAVGAFFYNLGKWLVQAFISVVKGLTTGDWEDFKNQVLKPLQQALEAFWLWLKQLIDVTIRALFQPVADAIVGLLVRIGAALAGAILRLGRLTLGDSADPGDILNPVGTRGTSEMSPTLHTFEHFQEQALELIEMFRRILAVGLVIGLVLTAIGLFVSVVGGVASFVFPLIQGLLVELILQAIGAAFAQAGQILEALRGLGELARTLILGFFTDVLLPGVETAGEVVDLIGFVFEGLTIAAAVYIGKSAGQLPGGAVSLGISLIILVIGILLYVYEKQRGDSLTKTERLSILAAGIVLDLFSAVLTVRELLRREARPFFLTLLIVVTLIIDVVGVALGTTEFILVAVLT